MIRPLAVTAERRRDPLTRLFMLIKEPRVARILQLAIYVGHIVAGMLVLEAVDSTLQDVLGQTLRLVFGWLLIVCALFGTIAVLPGVWWLERAGVFGLIMALAIYLVVLMSLGTGSGVGAVVTVILILQMVKRWTEIRRFQIAP